MSAGKIWLVVEGDEHGLRLCPNPAFNLVTAETSEAAAQQYVDRHEPDGDRLFVVPYEASVFKLSIAVKAVTP